MTEAGSGEPELELYGTRECPFTAELREELEWDGRPYRELEVDRDREAYERLLELTGGNPNVPVLVEDGEVVRVGFQGRTCLAARPPGD